MTSQTQSEDWTKFVTLQPPNEVKFKLTQDDVSEPQPVSSPDQQKAYAKIQIINNSKSSILFKVKTTNIKNYMVRPNADHIKPSEKVTVKIQTQTPIGGETPILKKDRFLVQLTKLDEAPTAQITPDQIAQMWEKVDKNKLVQYKLKVDLNSDVLQLIADRSPKDPQSMQNAQKEQVMTKIHGNVADKMLSDTRDNYEESKEKPEIKLSTYSQQKPVKERSAKMEDIKEHEEEDNVTLQSQVSIKNIQNVQKPAASTAASAAPKTNPNSSVKRKLEDAKSKKYELESLVARAKNSEKMIIQKNLAMGKTSSGSKTVEAGGFMLYHLIIMAVLGILCGAYIKTKFLTSTDDLGKVEL